MVTSEPFMPHCMRRRCKVTPKTMTLLPVGHYVVVFLACMNSSIMVPGMFPATVFLAQPTGRPSNLTSQGAIHLA